MKEVSRRRKKVSGGREGRKERKKGGKNRRKERKARVRKPIEFSKGRQTPSGKEGEREVQTPSFIPVLCSSLIKSFSQTRERENRWTEERKNRKR